jgi:hypothetical protein
VSPASSLLYRSSRLRSCCHCTAPAVGVPDLLLVWVNVTPGDTCVVVALALALCATTAPDLLLRSSSLLNPSLLPPLLLLLLLPELALGACMTSNCCLTAAPAFTAAALRGVELRSLSPAAPTPAAAAVPVAPAANRWRVLRLVEAAAAVSGTEAALKDLLVTLLPVLALATLALPGRGGFPACTCRQPPSPEPARPATG